MFTTNIGLRCLGAYLLLVLYKAVLVLLIANATVDGGLAEVGNEAAVQLAVAVDANPHRRARHDALRHLGSALHGPTGALRLSPAQVTLPFSVLSSRSNGLRAPPLI